MNRKYFCGDYTERDDDDFELLDSRLIHAVNRHGRRGLARTRPATDWPDREMPKSRPQYHRDRSY